MTPGFFGVVAGAVFFTEDGVGFVPSAFVVGLTVVVLFLRGVALVALEVVPVADFVR